MDDSEESLDPDFARRLSIIMAFSGAIATVGVIHLYFVFQPFALPDKILLAGQVLLTLTFFALALLFRGLSKRIRERESEDN